MKRGRILLLLTVISAIPHIAAEAQSGNYPTVLHRLSAKGNSPETRVECPTKVGVGVINVPQGWFSFTAREYLFNSLAIINVPSTKKINIVCQYGKQDDQAIVFEVPASYVCKESSNRTVVCKRLIIPKK